LPPPPPSTEKLRFTATFLVVRSHSYDDVLAGPRRKKVPEVPAEPGLVVEDPASG